jgi:hypothetical protein
MVASPTGCSLVLVSCHENVKVRYPVLHTDCLEGIVSGNRNSDTPGKKEAGNAPDFPVYFLRSGLVLI